MEPSLLMDTIIRGDSVSIIALWIRTRTLRRILLIRHRRNINTKTTSMTICSILSKSGSSTSCKSLSSI